MTSFTIIKCTDIQSLPLNPGGQRAGADNGDPQIATQILAREATGNLGVWECEPGGWPVVNRPDTEFTYIISGLAKLTDEASGQVVEVTGGDLIILPPGWSGRWDVIKKVRKVYAIY